MQAGKGNRPCFSAGHARMPEADDIPWLHALNIDTRTRAALTTQPAIPLPARGDDAMKSGSTMHRAYHPGSQP
jgi:hypothetical protein